ncbi:MAG: hypothetical protein PVH63_00855 [Balneolaceae bacterium]
MEKSIMAKSFRSFSGDKKKRPQSPFALMQKGEKIKAVDSESVSDCGRNNFDGPLHREAIIGLCTGTKLFCSPFLLHTESKARGKPGDTSPSQASGLVKMEERRSPCSPNGL